MVGAGLRVRMIVEDMALEGVVESVRKGRIALTTDRTARLPRVGQGACLSLSERPGEVRGVSGEIVEIAPVGEVLRVVVQAR